MPCGSFSCQVIRVERGYVLPLLSGGKGQMGARE
jgi:hypothetical protein